MENQLDFDNPYNPLDIKWIKNINNKITGKAYLELDSEYFRLNYPTHHKGNVLSAGVGDIILLWQKINEIPVFTHLVTPVDIELIDEINRSDYREDFRYSRNVKVIAIANPPGAIPVSESLWRDKNFAGISQGNACLIENISNIENLDTLIFDTWSKFTNFFIQPNLVRITNSLLDEIAASQETSVEEGALKLASHFIRERNRQIVNLKKQKAIRENKLYCEMCDFSFKNNFNVNFIECHHKVPISQAFERKTSLDDLQLVCSNCHRMLHKKFNGVYLTIEELKQHIKTIKN